MNRTNEAFEPERPGTVSLHAGLADPARIDAGRDRSTRPRLRVLILYAQRVLWSMGDGKGAEIFARLPSAIADRGHQVLLTMPGPEPGIDGREPDPATIDEHEPPRTVRYRGFDIQRVPVRRGFVADARLPLPARLADRLICWIAYQRWSLRVARALAKEARPDLVMGMGILEAPAAHRVARELGVPCIVRLFGNYMSLRLGHPLRIYADFPEVIAFRTPADLLVLNNDGADGEKVAAHIGVRAKRFVHVRNGVDFDLFRPGPANPDIRRRLGIRDDQPLLLTSTRMVAEKKLERAIEGLHALLPRHPDAALVILGSGPEQPRLEALARDLGLADRVHFPGAFFHEEIPEWLRAADVFLSLLDRTNAANPVYEAMACGLPIVALDVATVGELIRHGESGILLSHTELPRLGDILADLLDNPGLRRRLGENAARRIPEAVMGLQARLDFEVDLLEDLAWKQREAP